jgi:K+-transporting ATPase ATPase C chain
METLITSLRLVVATMLVCVAGYTAVILGVAQLLTPDTAQGSLIKRRDGTIVGSRLIAQGFEQAHYFWPRPSAASYNASAAAGSNKSPTSTDLTERAAKSIAQFGASADKPMPADLAAASGGGLDPHITERAALYQATRVASARGIERSQIEALIHVHTFSPSAGMTSDRLVNVLELNIALDEQSPPPPPKATAEPATSP